MCLPVSVCQAQFSCTALQLPQHGCTKLSRSHLPGLLQQDQHATGMSGSPYAELIVTSLLQVLHGQGQPGDGGRAA